MASFLGFTEPGSHLLSQPPKPLSPQFSAVLAEIESEHELDNNNNSIKHHKQTLTRAPPTIEITGPLETAPQSNVGKTEQSDTESVSSSPQTESTTTVTLRQALSCDNNATTESNRSSDELKHTKNKDKPRKMLFSALYQRRGSSPAVLQKLKDNNLHEDGQKRNSRSPSSKVHPAKTERIDLSIDVNSNEKLSKSGHKIDKSLLTRKRSRTLESLSLPGLETEGNRKQLSKSTQSLAGLEENRKFKPIAPLSPRTNRKVMASIAKGSSLKMEQGSTAKHCNTAKQDDIHPPSPRNQRRCVKALPLDNSWTASASPIVCDAPAPNAPVLQPTASKIPSDDAADQEVTRSRSPSRAHTKHSNGTDIMGSPGMRRKQEPLTLGRTSYAEVHNTMVRNGSTEAPSSTSPRMDHPPTIGTVKPSTSPPISPRKHRLGPSPLATNDTPETARRHTPPTSPKPPTSPRPVRRLANYRHSSHDGSSREIDIPQPARVRSASSPCVSPLLRRRGSATPNISPEMSPEIERKFQSFSRSMAQSPNRTAFGFEGLASYAKSVIDEASREAEENQAQLPKVSMEEVLKSWHVTKDKDTARLLRNIGIRDREWVGPGIDTGGSLSECRYLRKRTDDSDK